MVGLAALFAQLARFLGQLGGGMAAVVFRMVHGGLITVKQRMLSVFKRIPCLMLGHDVMVCAAVHSSLRVKSCRLLVMFGGADVVRYAGS
jgi:hypothetical protein